MMTLQDKLNEIQARADQFKWDDPEENAFYDAQESSQDVPLLVRALEAAIGQRDRTLQKHMSDESVAELVSSVCDDEIISILNGDG